MSRGKAMVMSHTLFFLLGITAAKLYDRDELNSYRSAHEGPMQKFRRYAGNITVGAVGFG